mmetsp:Transcript_38478/g.115399  ORF Transcript_38478/g.115399 Transcript_38478/m.115399 type:complete len:507 (-) Transcript_38478:52-1572(-)
MTDLPRPMAHLGHEAGISEPAGDLVGDAVGILAVIAESTVQDYVHVPGLLAGEEAGQHHGQTHRGGLRNRPGPGLGYQNVRRDHVLGHVGDEPQTHDVHPARSVISPLHLLGLLLGVRLVEGLLYPPGPVRPQESQRKELLLGEVTLPQHGIPALGGELLPQFIVPAAHDVDRRVDSRLAKLGVQSVHNVREGTDPLPPSHDEDDVPVVRGIDAERFSDGFLVLPSALGRPVTEALGLDGEVVTYGKARHDELVVGDASPLLGELPDALGGDEHPVDPLLEPRRVSAPEVGDDREERNVLPLLLGDLAGRDHGDVVHGRMDGDDDVRIVGFDRLAYASLAREPRVKVVADLVEEVVGQVIEEFPLTGVGRHVLVGRDEGAVGPQSRGRPDVEEVVGRAGVVHLKGLGEGFGRGAVTAARVGREEEDPERAALLLRELLDLGLDLRVSTLDIGDFFSFLLLVLVGEGLDDLGGGLHRRRRREGRLAAPRPSVRSRRRRRRRPPPPAR